MSAENFDGLKNSTESGDSSSVAALSMSRVSVAGQVRGIANPRAAADLDLASAYLKAGHVQEAIRALRRAGALHENGELAAFAKSLLEGHHQQPWAALEIYEAIFEKVPDHLLGACALGFALLDRQEAAINICEQIVDVNEITKLGETCLVNGRLHVAFYVYDRIETDPSPPVLDRCRKHFLAGGSFDSLEALTALFERFHLSSPNADVIAYGDAKMPFPFLAITSYKLGYGEGHIPQDKLERCGDAFVQDSLDTTGSTGSFNAHHAVQCYAGAGNNKKLRAVGLQSLTLGHWSAAKEAFDGLDEQMPLQSVIQCAELCIQRSPFPLHEAREAYERIGQSVDTVTYERWGEALFTRGHLFDAAKCFYRSRNLSKLQQCGRALAGKASGDAEYVFHWIAEIERAQTTISTI